MIELTYLVFSPASAVEYTGIQFFLFNSGEMAHAD